MKFQQLLLNNILKYIIQKMRQEYVAIKNIYLFLGKVGLLKEPVLMV